MENHKGKHYQEIVLENIEACFSLFRRLWQQGYYFRGHASAEFGLSTTLDRYGSAAIKKCELYLIREFRRRIHHYLTVQEMPSSTLELLSLMQHFGAPTRLLDFTRSPYVALYFAVRDVLNQNDSAIWALSPLKVNRISFKKIKEHTRPPFPLPLEEFHFRTLPHIFNKEDYFQEAFLSGKYDLIMALEPLKTNVRLNIQQGLFLIRGSLDHSFTESLSNLMDEIDLEPEPDDEDEFPTMMKYIIPQPLKVAMMRELEAMNINAATLFGGLEGFALSLRERAPALDDIDLEL